MRIANKGQVSKHVMDFAVENGRGGGLKWSVGKLLNVLHG
jgi:hypothetical protein